MISLETRKRRRKLGELDLATRTWECLGGLGHSILLSLADLAQLLAGQTAMTADEETGDVLRFRNGLPVDATAGDKVAFASHCLEPLLLSRIERRHSFKALR